MFPLPQVVADPSVCCPASVLWLCLCQARKLGEAVDLSESFMATLDEGEPSSSVSPPTESKNVLKCVCESDPFSADVYLSINVTREMLIHAQKNDLSLTLCLSSVVAAADKRKPVVLFSG